MHNEMLYLGCDSGLTPCIVIGQPAGYGKIRVLASLPCERGGIKQHLGNYVFPMFSYKLPNFVHLAQDE